MVSDASQQLVDAKTLEPAVLASLDALTSLPPRLLPAVSPTPMPLFSGKRKFALANAQRRGRSTPDSEELNVAKHRDYLMAMRLHVRLVTELQQEVPIRYDLLNQITTIWNSRRYNTSDENNNVIQSCDFQETVDKIPAVIQDNVRSSATPPDAVATTAVELPTLNQASEPTVPLSTSNSNATNTPSGSDLSSRTTTITTSSLWLKEDMVVSGIEICANNLPEPDNNNSNTPTTDTVRVDSPLGDGDASNATLQHDSKASCLTPEPVTTLAGYLETSTSSNKRIPSLADLRREGNNEEPIRSLNPCFRQPSDRSLGITKATTAFVDMKAALSRESTIGSSTYSTTRSRTNSVAYNVVDSNSSGSGQTVGMPYSSKDIWDSSAALQLYEDERSSAIFPESQTRRSLSSLGQISQVPELVKGEACTNQKQRPIGISSDTTFIDITGRSYRERRSSKSRLRSTNTTSSHRDYWHHRRHKTSSQHRSRSHPKESPSTSDRVGGGYNLS